MKKGKNMINQKNDLNMITRKLETGLWYYNKDNGMIISHKDSFNHTIKNLIDEMIYDCHIEIEEVEETKATEEAEETKATEEIPNVKKCSIAYCCQADRKHNRCGGTQTCRTTWKRYKAIINPEWHHVSLATLANIDFDMLDKKRQVYLKAHRELKRTLVDLSKCKTGHTYEARARKFMRDMISKYYDNEISYAMRKYLDLQLSMSNVVNGVWSSNVEPAMGLHESRRYSRPTLTY